MNFTNLDDLDDLEIDEVGTTDAVDEVEAPLDIIDPDDEEPAFAELVNEIAIESVEKYKAGRNWRAPVLESLDMKHYANLGSQAYAFLKFGPVRMVFEPKPEWVEDTRRGYIYMTFDYNYDNYPIAFPYNVMKLDEIAEYYSLHLRELDAVLDSIFTNGFETFKVAKNDYLEKAELEQIFCDYCKLMNIEMYDYVAEKYKKSKKNFIKGLFSHRDSFVDFKCEVDRTAKVLGVLRERYSKRELANVNQISQLCGVRDINTHRTTQERKIKPKKILIGNLSEHIDDYRDILYYSDNKTYKNELTSYKAERKAKALPVIASKELVTTAKEHTDISQTLFIFEAKGFTDDEITHTGRIYSINRRKAEVRAAKLFSLDCEGTKDNWEAYIDDVEVEKIGKALTHKKQSDSTFVRIQSG